MARYCYWRRKNNGNWLNISGRQKLESNMAYVLRIKTASLQTTKIDRKFDTAFPGFFDDFPIKNYTGSEDPILIQFFGYIYALVVHLDCIFVQATMLGKPSV